MMKPSEAYPDTSDADWAPHAAFLADDGMLEMSLGGFLVRSGDRTVLVDAGVGRITEGLFQGGRLLDNLDALGVQPGDVTDVVFTHLHFDHVGWATQQGSIVFPNANWDDSGAAGLEHSIMNQRDSVLRSADNTLESST